MKSPYDDKLTVQDIAALRGCGEQQVRVIIRRLGVKPLERLGTACIYSAQDSKRLVDYDSVDGRPKLYGAEDCLNLSGCHLLNGKYFEYLDYIERNLKGVPAADGQKYRHCWSSGMKKSVSERRPAWKKEKADAVVALIICDLTESK